MLRWIQGVFSRTYYVQLWELRIKVQSFGSAEVFDEKPYIATNNNAGKTSVVAVGNAAYDMRSNTSLSVINPFSHPRLLVANFTAAEQVLNFGIKSLSQNKLIAPSPVVVIHPREKLEGGVTDVEDRLYRELALGAGARKVFLHLGDELQTDSFHPDLLIPKAY
ncbi:rod shape-determining protein [Gilvimarinus sp. SDUM040013]|uniref:Rod shape-determining protein n=1 Tax=Gilvimarinus gilvus TaxID=3058038 RepID=A0ABU4RUZ4_9GAMM|nr:rod shape-determining protein [Gilvimarinus sp. SDUM040013]MDO3387930.1 rod shape-determining protein [Gilvimarinus sp. SDUM040013]MDX6848699.1 rod shape-determining protein [Gilvimarinus sp. SDUM040013]